MAGDKDILGVLEAGSSSDGAAAPQGDSDILGLLNSQPVTPWEQFDAAQENAAKPPEYGFADTLARGVTFSGFDRALAFARSLRSGLPYETELSHLDLERQKYSEANPLKAATGEFMGALVPTIPAMALGQEYAIGPMLGAASRLAPRVAGSMLGRGAGYLATGAGQGIISSELTSPLSGESPGEALKSGAIYGPIGKAAGDVLTAPLRANIPAYAAATAQKLRDAGLTLYPGQIPGGPSVSKLFGTAPSGEQIDQLTRGVARSFGADADTLTPDFFRGPQGILGRIGADLENAARSSAGIPARDPGLLGDFNQTLQRAASEFGGKDSAEYRKVLGLFSDISAAAKSGTISGKSYQDLTQKGSALWNAQSRTSPVRQYAIELKQALDGALERNNPAQAKDIAAGRHAYHNALIAEDAVDGNGKIDPRALARKVESNAGGYGSFATASRKAAESGAASDIGVLGEGAGMMLSSGKAGGLPAFIGRHPLGAPIVGAIAGEHAASALEGPMLHLAEAHPVATGLLGGLGGLYAGLGTVASRPSYANLLLSGVDPSRTLALALIPGAERAKPAQNLLYGGGQ